MLLFTPGGSEQFSCGEIKGKEDKSAREKQAAVRSVHVPKAAAPRGVFLVGFGGTGRIPERGFPWGTVG